MDREAKFVSRPVVIAVGRERVWRVQHEAKVAVFDREFVDVVIAFIRCIRQCAVGFGRFDQFRVRLGEASVLIVVGVELLDNGFQYASVDVW